MQQASALQLLSRQQLRFGRTYYTYFIIGTEAICGKFYIIKFPNIFVVSWHYYFKYQPFKKLIEAL